MGKMKWQKNRPGWFKFYKMLMLKRYPRPQFIYLGKPFEQGAIVISNHEGTDAPMSMELWCDAPVRFWGASEMNSGLVSMYKYQSRVYYHEKKHWNLHLARLFCLIASPLTNLFYKGLNLISSYRDGRLIKTIRESIETIKEGTNVVIFPEDSTNGYLEELEGFYLGFTLLAESCLKKGIDAPIFVTYFRKKDLKYIIDAPVYYSQLIQKYKTREEIAQQLVKRCNDLGKLNFDKKQFFAEKNVA